MWPPQGHTVTDVYSVTHPGYQASASTLSALAPGKECVELGQRNKDLGFPKLQAADTQEKA